MALVFRDGIFQDDLYREFTSKKSRKTWSIGYADAYGGLACPREHRFELVKLTLPDRKIEGEPSDDARQAVEHYLSVRSKADFEEAS